MARRGGVQPDGASLDQVLRTELDDALSLNAQLRKENESLRKEVAELRGKTAEGSGFFGSFSPFAPRPAETKEDMQLRVTQLQAKVKELQEKLQIAQQVIDLRFQRSSRRLSRSDEKVRLEGALERNIAREMRIAQEGRELEKVTEKHTSAKSFTSKVRFVVVNDAQRKLKWGHAPGPLDNSCKTLDLDTVYRIDYGHAAQIRIREHGVLPWLCFSLVTSERTFDFICPDEDAIRCFVLTLSRVCHNACGGPLTRRQFILAKAWCKIRESCRRRRITLTAAVLYASIGAAPSGYHRRVDSDLFSFLGEDGPSGPAAVASQSQPLLRPPAAPASRAAEPESSASFQQPASLSYGSGKNTRAWPKVGETWTFTGTVEKVEVYKDPEGKEWANQLKCRSKELGRTSVTIISSGASMRFVEIRGTDKMKFIKGWIEVVNAEGTWLLERNRGEESGGLSSLMQRFT